MKLFPTAAAIAVAAISFANIAVAQSLDDLLAGADAGAGERAFRQCKPCHTVESGGANRTGPNLYNALGRDVAAADFRYSKALQEFGGTWTVERLYAFLENPRKAIPGTKMTYRGLSDAKDRANMIAFLNQNSDAPQDFGSAGTESQAVEQEEDFGQLFIAPGVEETYYACTACHSEMIVAQQGKTRDGWDDLLDWMIEEQGMSELPSDERDIILDYLAEHYNIDRPNFPRN